MRVKLFARLREAVGLGQVELDLEERATAGDAVELLGRQFPGLRSLLDSAAVAINGETALPGAMLKPGDELALLPPFSGGAYLYGDDVHRNH